MESWSCISEGKGLVVSDGTISLSDSLSRSRNGLMGWELKTPCTFMESQGFGELGFPEMVGKHLQNDSIRDAVSTSMSTPNLFFGEDESSSRISSSIVDSSSRDSSLIDLKLGRLADHRDVHSSKLSKGTLMLSSSGSSTPPKRMRVLGMYPRPAYCQVYGCNKDLSSYKDYHKRHKVCEVHSKTAKVIVNGIEQRFCQQCSRFHLLGEFDDGKRSCRRRLAGHNERRRKPQMGSHPGRAGRFPQSFDGGRFEGNKLTYAYLAGGRFEGNKLTTASFICQEILPTDIPEKYGMGDWCRHVKVEGGTHYRPFSGMPVTNGHLHSKPVFPSYDIGKQYPSFHENGTNPLTASIFSQNGSQYPQDVRGLSSGSHSIFHETALGSQDFNVFNATSAVPGLSGISDSGCARSLLSSQSQNSSSYSSGIPIARPFIIAASHKFPSSGMNSGARSHLSPILLSNDCDDTNDFGISDGIIQGSGFVNTKDRLPCQDGATIDLLQLSSQLQQVEDQRQSMQAKQENDAFCCLRIT